METVSDIVEDTLVFHVDSMDPPVLGQPAGRWRVEKKRTGDPNVDEVRDKGAGVLLDDLGRRRAVFNAEGRRVYSWNPPKAGA